jgi:hypothetical protein
MAKSQKPAQAKKSAQRADSHQAKKPRLPKQQYLDWRTFDLSTFAHNDRFKLMEELLTYRDHLKELLHHKGKYVLIKGREVIGIYADEREAICEAATRFGGEPVLIKQIAVKELIHSMGGIAY